jgi:hypothetical protein
VILLQRALQINFRMQMRAGSLCDIKRTIWQTSAGAICMGDVRVGGGRIRELVDLDHLVGSGRMSSPTCRLVSSSSGKRTTHFDTVEIIYLLTTIAWVQLLRSCAVVICVGQCASRKFPQLVDDLHTSKPPCLHTWRTACTRRISPTTLQP